MANYPSIPQSFGSLKESSYGTQVDIAVSGATRFRSLYSRDWAVFRLRHVCTETQMQALLTHYDQHATISFSFYYVADGQAYTVRYAEYPQAKLLDQSSEWEVQTVLVQV